jgi:hypothetical protein
MPKEALTPLMKVLLWPFRMPGIAIVTVIVTLLVVWLMFPISQALDSIITIEDGPSGCPACLATLMLGLYALMMTTLPRVLVGIFKPRKPAGPIRISDLSLSYNRTCQDCGFSWTWNPEASADPRLRHPMPVASQRSSASLQTAPAKQPHGRTQVPFTCPACGTQTTYDPWLGPATCPNCDYSPSGSRKMRSALQRARIDAYLPYLRDFFDHWDGMHLKFNSFDSETSETALTSFQAYRAALGEALDPSPGTYYSSGYFRAHHPTEQQIMDFVSAYGALHRGEVDQARHSMEDLAARAPQFVEPSLWLAALYPDPAKRRTQLEHAYSVDPAHPLVVDIRAIARGEISSAGHVHETGESVRVEAHACPKCGGKLHYEPGARQVECVHCGSTIDLRLLDILRRPAPQVSAMRLQRKFQSQTWRDLERIVVCDACGSRITLSDRFAKTCAFCGSSNVLVEDLRVPLHQPNAILPFALDADRAIQQIQRGKPSFWNNYWGWRAYRDLHIERLVGLYLPFWVFDGVVKPIWAWLAKDGTLSKLSGPEEILSIDGLLFSGTNRSLPSHLDQVSDYDLSTLAEYETYLLADWPAVLYDIDIEDAVEEAYTALITIAHTQLGPPILPGVEAPPGARAIRTLQVSQTTYQLVLLPLWIADLRSRAGNSIAWINGQTGTTLLSFVEGTRTDTRLVDDNAIQTAPLLNKKKGKIR